MIVNFRILIFLSIALAYLACDAQNTNDNSQILSDNFDRSSPFKYGMPEYLNSIDTCPAWNHKGIKVLLTGTVFERDGKTPASDIILYYYQTNNQGKYSMEVTETRNMPRNSLGQSHGYMRGWIKTDHTGKYSIYTTLPGSYPSRNEPAHIHLSVLEKKMKSPYYLDNFVFDNDRLLTKERRQKMNNRGGNGVIRFAQTEGFLIGERNIILGLNIPDYPKQNNQNHTSGKHIGEDIHSFTPVHAYGPDKGTKMCPICKYGWFHGVLYFVGNNPDWSEIRLWLRYFESVSSERKEYLKVYFVYGNEYQFDAINRQSELEKLGKDLDLKKVALTFVPSFSNQESGIYLNRIDPFQENTIILFKRSTIIDKFINLEPIPANFELISSRLDQSENEYFRLPRSKNKM